MKKAILYTGGIINFVFAVFHMFFWKLMNWAEELPKLSRDNQGIMQIADIIIIFILLYFAVMSFIIARQNRIDLYVKSIILLISGFYLIRLVAGFILFGFNTSDLFISMICVFIIAGYLSVIFIKRREVL